MRIAIYGRVSTDKQDTLNQLRQLREFASGQDWMVVGEFVDIGSGKSGDREKFKALFAAASRREFDLVLFWSLEPLAKSRQRGDLEAGTANFRIGLPRATPK
jgi:DNA invertase Pin-like site-specific DNA recombinase